MGTPGMSSWQALMPMMLAGLWSGARGLHSSIACMTSSVMVPKKSRSCAVRVMRQNAATPTPRIALKPTSWPALLAASSGRLAPRCWLVTTAPPVASAPNSVMISWLIISTSDTPEIAASPTDDTITVSAMPTRISSICSMMSGQSSVSSWRLVNSLSFFILQYISLSQC